MWTKWHGSRILFKYLIFILPVFIPPVLHTHKVTSLPWVQSSSKSDAKLYLRTKVVIICWLVSPVAHFRVYNRLVLQISSLWVEWSSKSDMKPYLRIKVMVMCWLVSSVAHIRVSDRSVRSFGGMVIGRGKSSYLVKNLPQCHFLNHKSHMHCNRIESGPEWWDVGIWCMSFDMAWVQSNEVNFLIVYKIYTGCWTWWALVNMPLNFLD